MIVEGQTVTVNISASFSDPDGDALSHAATTSNAEVATVAVSENRAVRHGRRAGRGRGDGHRLRSGRTLCLAELRRRGGGAGTHDRDGHAEHA